MKLFQLLLIMNTLKLLSPHCMPLPTLAGPPPTTFDTYLQSLDQWEYQLLHDSTTNTDVFGLSETFQTNPKIIAASDGFISSSVRA